MTEAEYLAWDDVQELKHEFDGLRPVAMVGATTDHDRIRGNLYFELNGRLRGGPCEPFGPDMRVPTGRGRYRYPDAVVTCTPVAGGSRDISAPVIIFEVLSESTYEADCGSKLVEYRSIPSLIRHVMLEQTVRMATVITRAGDIWSIDVLRSDETQTLPELGIEIPLPYLYIRTAAATDT